jgi:hypothetical protein
MRYGRVPRVADIGNGFVMDDLKDNLARQRLYADELRKVREDSEERTGPQRAVALRPGEKGFMKRRPPDAAPFLRKSASRETSVL